MGNIVDYIKKYKDKTFYEEEFNEIDNLVFSLISYINFDGIVSKKRKYIKLNTALKKYISQNNLIDVGKGGITSIEGYKILKLVIDTKRYRNVLVYNYIYQSDNNKQFCALTFKIKYNLLYIVFEGTDNLISGWKEDFQMSYEFPIPSQKCAIEYINKTVKLFDGNIIIGGHSKGGNLALVAGMYSNMLVRSKIKRIYSNDGPGLYMDNIDLNKYEKIKDKYIHFIPNYSYVGVLLNNDKYEVIKSTRKDIISHSIFTWEIDDNKLIRTILSASSETFKNNINNWIKKHDINERRRMFESVFNALEEAKIDNLGDFISIRNMIKVIKNLNSIDAETKDIILSFIKLNTLKEDVI